MFTLRQSRQFQKVPFKKYLLIFHMCMFTQSSKHLKTIILTVLGRNTVSVTIKHIEKREHFIQTNDFCVTQSGSIIREAAHQIEKVGEAAEINKTERTQNVESNLRSVKLNPAVSGICQELIPVFFLVWVCKLLLDQLSY